MEIIIGLIIGAIAGYIVSRLTKKGNNANKDALAQAEAENQKLTRRWRSR